MLCAGDLYGNHYGGGRGEFDPRRKKIFGTEYFLEFMKEYGLELYGYKILGKTHHKKFKQERWFHLEFLYTEKALDHTQILCQVHPNKSRRHTIKVS